MRRTMRAGMFVAALIPLIACQSPTDPDETLDVDDFVDATAAPNPAIATESRGRSYRVVRGNNQPDDILEYDWMTSFSVVVTLNNNANDNDLDLQFPVRITSVSVRVQQAVGGIVTPPTGGDTEKFEAVPTQASGNQFGAVNQPITLSWDVWYDLPSLRREALLTVTIAMADDNGKSFSKIVELRVAP